MHRELPETSHQFQEQNPLSSSHPSHQHGFHQLHQRQQGGTAQDPLRHRARSASPQSVPSTSNAYIPGVAAQQLDARLRGLKVGQLKTPGARISQYENALTPSTPRQALGFKVIKRADASEDGVQLLDFPNEILTHILSHLHPDSHASVALVSKRLYSLVTTSHAWRMAFQRYFPGQDALEVTDKANGKVDDVDSEFIRSEVRYFSRLTARASWRSEYLLRTRLLRSLARGKPGSSSGGIGTSSRSSPSGKKANAVLTYNSKLPSMVTNLHATFVSTGKKPPRVIHGAADMCVGSASDPTSGKVEKWGLDDPFAFAQLDEVVPQLLPYGVGEGPAAVPNVMDVSQVYGVVGGEGFPGGRVFYRPASEFRGKYLVQEQNVIEAHPDIPKIPELSEGVCSVWIAKSPAVPSLTQSMVGMMTGSTLGVVTAYALGFDPSGPRYTSGEISARWVLSPGVPIIAIKVDESYSQKRNAAGRVWAVALNALGEVFYLNSTPTPLAMKSKSDSSVRCAWYSGRSAYWHLVEPTRRQARPGDFDKNAVRGAYSPRSPSNAMNLKRDQMVAEAREIEKFLRYKPVHFRKVCSGWDMRRRLEVDFASDDTHGAGEAIFVIDCGLEEDQKPAVTRFTRDVASRKQPGAASNSVPPPVVEELPVPSLFGGGNPEPTLTDTPASPFATQALPRPGLQNPNAETNSRTQGMDEWHQTTFLLKECDHAGITTSSTDMSLYGLMTSFEDPLIGGTNRPPSAPATTTDQCPLDIPGRRARMLGIGTNSGLVMLWNMREGHASAGVQPVRILQTESPAISCIALSALYLVHGGSDGLVQAWDPLGSTLDPIRTLSSRSGRIPRHMISANPALGNINFSAAGAIVLDPDPTVLRGIVSFGTFVRYWAYSSSGQPAGRKRRLRHSDVHGRVSSRRQGGGVKGYIAAEAEELRLEQELKSREQAHLRSRFGVGLGDLTEEEAIRYAEMVSQEAYLLHEQRRTSASDTGSAADCDTTSATGSLDTMTPDPSVTGLSPPVASSSAIVNVPDEESNYELQIQQAIRLSLMEGVNDIGQSPRTNSSGDYEFPIVPKGKRDKFSPSSSPPSSHTPMVQRAEYSSMVASPSEEDAELELAMRLSLAEAESQQFSSVGLGVQDDEFPALNGFGKGKGKAI
ncbi:uncharacterized protein BCR38DRAFT_340950 [Pseudomassariella vexata]|uniref:F-box domain-containing protein n=1 Tax=Pseudomassariella vexata TaxID=1141098 RepID=A0A1Y2E0K6_9PEZI|nr:uncharacterized protein BCR38DRAFT_340950 [Pseudomassariella vexata]ORY65073.1 hypothetical protein BCR38DRAFT_340950 [Pseudomassariella vexata]